MQQEYPLDLVVATGETRSVRDMCAYVFKQLGLDYENYVIQNTKFLRPEELPYLRGDSSKIRALGWSPEYTFETMMDEMIAFWMDSLRS
jgi:GDPmannose 4,6-dehydratase